MIYVYRVEDNITKEESHKPTYEELEDIFREEDLSEVGDIEDDE
jgi:hypothetical protein